MDHSILSCSSEMIFACFQGGDVAVHSPLGLALQGEEEGEGQCQKGAVQVILLSYIMNIEQLFD